MQARTLAPPRGYTTREIKRKFNGKDETFTIGVPVKVVKQTDYDATASAVGCAPAKFIVTAPSTAAASAEVIRRYRETKGLAANVTVLVTMSKVRHQIGDSGTST